MKLLKSLLFLGFFTLLINSTVFAQQTGSIGGQVYDANGAVLRSAEVRVVDAAGKEKTVTTNGQGEFTVTGLAPGKYIVRALAPSFSLYENAEVEVIAGQKTELTIALTIQAINEVIDIGADQTVNTDPADNRDANVFKEKDIENLPDDPDELQAYLQALAGPSAGPDGAQFYIDGFQGGRFPPKEAIREIRINSNPFSAEFDRIGFQRIEILTKPGFEKFRGSAFFNFNDESLNSRNPFALNRAPSQQRNYGGSFGGPIKKGKASYFMDISNRENDANSVIAATILDPSLNIVAFNQDVTVPTRRFSLSPRLDFQINEKNTMIVRYNFSRNKSENQGIGGFSLPTRASQSSSTENEIQLTESMIINPKTINETRFRFEYDDRRSEGDNTIPTINVSSAFIGGGAQVGLNYTKTKSYELQNYTTTTLGSAGQHAVKFGIRLRGVSIDDRSESGYGGSFTFAGVRDTTTGAILFSSIEQYRQRVLGSTDPRFFPSQYSITTGNPLADVSQTDVGLFITDDWKVRPDLTLSAGLRYENQNNISDNLNFAPRLSFAYAPGAGGSKQPKTTFRGGFGLFYSRFGENFTLTSERFNGTSQLQYIVTNNTALLGQASFNRNGTVTNAPTAAQLATLAPQANTIRQIANDLQAPYSIQSVFSVDRQLPRNTTLSGTFLMTRNVHTLRLRNINAPVCDALQVCTATSPRPNPALGNIYYYESSGSNSQQQFNLRMNTRLTTGFFLFANYGLSFGKGNTDSFGGFGGGGASFPAYSYNLTGEYADLPISRHSFNLGGSVTIPWNIRVSPQVSINSGRRFNIVTGLDTNRDSVFTERPTYAALNARCTELGLTNSFCNIGGISNPGTTIISRNLGTGPSYFVTNVQLTKTFSFGGSENRAANGQGNGQGGGGGRQGGGGGGRGGAGGGPVFAGGGGGGGFFGGGGDRSKYNLSVGVNIQNLFNTVNFANPQGNLSSPFFGRSTSTGGNFSGGGFGGGGFSSGSANRRIELTMRFNF